METFTKLSIEITKKLDKKTKKENGIYFTPLTIIKRSVDRVLSLGLKIKKILEPSCGSCEFIRYIDKKLFNMDITGVEFNKDIYKEIKDISFSGWNSIDLINRNYITERDDKKYDLIIGNPPFYVMKKADIDKKYLEFVEGRPNIFIIFILESLLKLNDDGVLSFVLPKNFMNCLYYNKVRQYINDNYTIIDIIECNNDSYLETAQDTIIFIVQNKKNIELNRKWILEQGDIIIFNTEDNIKKLKKLYENSSSLKELDYCGYIGTVVWNQKKDILTDDSSKTRLIYSSDIEDKKLIIKNYKNIQKKNYIDLEGSKDLLLVLNRGYGKGSYQFNYCLIDVDYPYLIENHLICIKNNKKISRKAQLKRYKKIIKSLKNPKTKKFVSLYFCNNAINIQELLNILPIY